MLLLRDQRKHQRIIKEAEPESVLEGCEKITLWRGKFLQIKVADGGYLFVLEIAERGIAEIVPVHMFVRRQI